jgi:tetratricopeptide (TPR) repeat protein
MMKISSLTLIVLAGLPAAATASVVTMGSGYAASCYQAADARAAGQTEMAACNRALTEQALDLDDRVATHVNRGILHLLRADTGQANADFDAALAMNPNQAEAWLNKAIVHARFGRPVDAMPMVQKALQLKTRRAALAYFVRAMAYEDSGNIRAAYNDLKRAQTLEPKWKEPEIELRRFKVQQI